MYSCVFIYVWWIIYVSICISFSPLSIVISVNVIVLTWRESLDICVCGFICVLIYFISFSSPGISMSIIVVMSILIIIIIIIIIIIMIILV